MTVSRPTLVAGLTFLAVAISVLAAVDVTAQGSLATIDWDAAKAAAQSDESLRLARTINLSREDQERIGLPVLLPATDDIARTIRVTPMDKLYTATFKDGTATVTITGSRVIGATPSPPIATPPSGKTYRVERTDSGLDLNFARFGAAYVISVECAKPETDAQCAKDDYALGLMDSLGVVLGDGVGGLQ